MTTKNPFVDQWMELNKLAIDSFQKMATNNVTTTNQMLTGFVDVRGVAELTQSYLSLFKGMGEVYTNSVNDVFKTQLEVLNLQATSKAYKDFGEFYLDAMTKLGKNQADWMQLYIDMMSSYLARVSEAKEVSDLALYVPKQTLTDEFQKKANDTLEQTLYLLNSLNVGIELMTQKNLDAMAEAWSTVDCWLTYMLLAKNMEDTRGIMNGLNRAIDISTKEYLNAIAAEGNQSSS